MADSEAARAAGQTPHAWLDDQACYLPPGAGGLVLLPYFLAGEKTPLHDPRAKGTLVGLGLHHELRHIWRAALESVAFGFRHHMDVFEEMDCGVGRVLCACDGGAASDLWMQITADILERPVERLLEHPGSSLGAAFVAGMGTGALDDWSAIGRYARCDRIFEPDDSRTEARLDGRAELGRSRSAPICHGVSPGPRHRNAYGIYRDLYRRLETLYPSLADLPAA